MRFVTRVFFTVKIYSRRTFSTSAKIPPYVDTAKKLIYGGDMSVRPSEEAFGSLLYKRMIQNDRRNKIFQICAKTERTMTTGEFLKSCVAVAEGMKARGIKKGDCLFLLGHNSLDINIVLVAALFIAAVPFPVSYKMSTETFQNVLKRMQPKFFWCEKSYLYSFKETAVEIGKLNPQNIFTLNRESATDAEGLEQFTQGAEGDFENFRPTDVENCKDELALAVNAITFGGLDRTVGLTHYNLNSVIARYDDTGHGDSYSDRIFLMVQKVFWISGLYPLLLSCAFGSRIIIMDTFREDNFLKYMDQYQVSHVHLYPSKWWRLFKYNSEKTYDFAFCKWAYAINESVSQILKGGLKEKYGLNVHFIYVLSEMSGAIFRNEYEDEKTLSVGQIYPELYAKVVSTKTSKALGPNEKGELCFKGLAVFKGYINNKKATQQVFDKEGFLLSGYYGYYDEEGNFYVIDRIIYQIKYKEFKISPKDIEGVILSLPAVKDVCVTGIAHKKDGAYPLALVVLRKGEKMTEEEIISYVNERVQEHKKLRGGVVFVSKIPRFRETGLIRRLFLQNLLSKYRIKDTSDEAASNQYDPVAEKR